MLETTDLGLTDQEIENRIDKFRTNSLKPKKKKIKIRFFYRNLKIQLL